MGCEILFSEDSKHKSESLGLRNMFRTGRTIELSSQKEGLTPEMAYPPLQHFATDNFLVAEIGREFGDGVSCGARVFGRWDRCIPSPSSPYRLLLRSVFLVEKFLIPNVSEMFARIPTLAD